MIEIPENKTDISQAIAQAVETLTLVYRQIGDKPTGPISIQNTTGLPLAKILGALNLLKEKGQIRQTEDGLYCKGH